MGMFDEVVWQGVTYQTKDLYNELHTLAIRHDQMFFISSDGTAYPLPLTASFVMYSFDPFAHTETAYLVRVESGTIVSLSRTEERGICPLVRIPEMAMEMSFSTAELNALISDVQQHSRWQEFRYNMQMVWLDFKNALRRLFV